MTDAAQHATGNRGIQNTGTGSVNINQSAVGDYAVANNNAAPHGPLR